LANAGLMEIFMVHHEAASRKGDAGFTMEPVRAFDCGNATMTAIS